MTSEPKRRKPAPQRGGRKKEWARAIVLIILAVIMVLAAVVAVLYARWVKKPSLPSGDGPTVESGRPVESDQPGTDIDSVQPKVSGERKSQDFYTILVFGPDETSGLTDTMMLVSYDVTNQKATVMSFPRDTLINSSGSSVTQKMLNAVYNRYGQGEAGVEGLKNEIAELVGFLPDYYVKIDWKLVGQMVDAIGGVWFDVPTHMEYYDPGQDLNIYFEPGYQYLDGEDAMNLVRWRHNNPGIPTEGGGSDIFRLEVQHQFLKAVLEQTLQLKNITKIGELAELFGENVESDLSIENLLWFASQAVFGGLGIDDVNFVTMPYYGVYSGRFANRVYPNQSELLSIINESLNPFVDEVTLNELDLISVSADGNILYSSTGVLADPSAGIPPVSTPEPEPEPTPSQPPASQEPVESQPPQVSQEPEPSPGGGEVTPPPETSVPPEEPEISEEPVTPPETGDGTQGQDPAQPGSSEQSDGGQPETDA